MISLCRAFVKAVLFSLLAAAHTGFAQGYPDYEADALRSPGERAAAQFLRRSPNEVRIGVIAPLSDPAGAALVDTVRNGVKLAQAHAAAQSGTMETRLILRNETAVWGSVGNTLIDLVNRNGVSAVLFAVDAPYVHCVADLAPRLGVPVIVLGSASPGPKAHHAPWLFAPMPSDEAQCATLAALAGDVLGLRRVAVIRGMDRCGRYGTSGFFRAMCRRGAPVPLDLLCSPAQRRFDIQVDRVRRLGPDGVLLWTRPECFVQLALQLRYSGFRGPILTSYSMLTADVVPRLGPAATGVYLAAPFSPFSATDVPAAWHEFRAAYAREYGHAPDLLAGYAYGAYRAVASVAARVGPSGERIRDELEAISRQDPSLWWGLDGTLRVIGL